jgi:hypothetical protein
MALFTKPVMFSFNGVIHDDADGVSYCHICKKYQEFAEQKS